MDDMTRRLVEALMRGSDMNGYVSNTGSSPPTQGWRTGRVSENIEDRTSPDYSFLLGVPLSVAWDNFTKRGSNEWKRSTKLTQKQISDDLRWLSGATTRDVQP